MSLRSVRSTISAVGIGARCCAQRSSGSWRKPIRRRASTYIVSLMLSCCGAGSNDTHRETTKLHAGLVEVP